MKTTTQITRFQISDAIVSAMESDGNPAVRRAGGILRDLVTRHARGDYDRAKDIQCIDDANFFLPVDYRYELLYSESV